MMDNFKSIALKALDWVLKHYFVDRDEISAICVEKRDEQYNVVFSLKTTINLIHVIMDKHGRVIKSCYGWINANY